MSNATIIFLVFAGFGLLGLIATFLFDRGHHKKVKEGVKS